MYHIVLLFYRTSNFLFRLRIPVLPSLLTYFNRLVFSVWLPHSTSIGKRFVLGYGGLGVVIHNRTVIGEDCHIDQNVTIGGTTKKYGVPVLGNSVYVGAGAKILGPIEIGDNVVIGANSVVVTSIPSCSLVTGVPGKVVKSGIKKSDYV